MDETEPSRGHLQHEVRETSSGQAAGSGCKASESEAEPFGR
jgi:hypothetical protein